MATCSKEGGASALPFDLASTVGQKVVRLPTAPRRRVQQRWNNQTRALAFPLRDQWPGRYIAPSTRAKLEQAALIESIKPDVALALAVAIFGTLPDERKRFAEMLLAVGEAQGRHSCAQARAWVTSITTVAESYSLDAALRIIRGEG
jgi:hypothetical protein